MTRNYQNEQIILAVLRDNLGDWKDIDSLRNDPRIYQRMGAHPGVLGQLLARLERRGEIERDLRGHKRIARAVMTPEAVSMDKARAEILAPEPEPERMSTSYRISTAVPELYAGVTERGAILIGEKPNGGGINWTHRLRNPDELYQVLEQCRVDQRGIEWEKCAREVPDQMLEDAMTAWRGSLGQGQEGGMIAAITAANLWDVAMASQLRVAHLLRIMRAPGAESAELGMRRALGFVMLKARETG